MPTLKADNKMRDLCLKQDGAILLVEPGFQDRVIRILPLPEIAKRCKEEHDNRYGPHDHVTIDLGNGPGIEAWNEIVRVIQLQAPRDRAIPQPKLVAEHLGGAWELSPEEVPLVKLTGDTSPHVVTLSKSDPVVPAATAQSVVAAIPPTDPAKPGEVPLLDAAAANQKEKTLKIMKCDVEGCPVECKGAFGMKVHKRKAHKG